MLVTSFVQSGTEADTTDAATLHMEQVMGDKWTAKHQGTTAKHQIK